jgi:hypothetical protein
MKSRRKIRGIFAADPRIRGNMPEKIPHFPRPEYGDRTGEFFRNTTGIHQ